MTDQRRENRVELQELAGDAVFRGTAWLQWINHYTAEETPHPEVHRMVRLVVEAAADGRDLTAAEGYEVKRILEPFLEVGFKKTKKPELNFETREKHGGTLTPDDALGQLRARSWINMRDLIDMQLNPLFPECCLVLGLFHFLEDLEHKRIEVSMKRCSVCRDFFIDNSRAQHAEFCSTRCRVRNARA